MRPRLGRFSIRLGQPFSAYDFRTRMFRLTCPNPSFTGNIVYFNVFCELFSSRGFVSFSFDEDLGRRETFTLETLVESSKLEKAECK
jgi:hypothetical protein